MVLVPDVVRTGSEVCLFCIAVHAVVTLYLSLIPLSLSFHFSLSSCIAVNGPVVYAVLSEDRSRRQLCYIVAQCTNSCPNLTFPTGPKVIPILDLCFSLCHVFNLFYGVSSWYVYVALYTGLWGFECFLGFALFKSIQVAIDDMFRCEFLPSHISSN